MPKNNNISMPAEVKNSMLVIVYEKININKYVIWPYGAKYESIEVTAAELGRINDFAHNNPKVLGLMEI